MLTSCTLTLTDEDFIKFLTELNEVKEGIEKFLIRNPDTCFVAEDSEIIGVILAGNDGRRGYEKRR